MSFFATSASCAGLTLPAPLRVGGIRRQPTYNVRYVTEITRQSLTNSRRSLSAAHLGTIVTPKYLLVSSFVALQIMYYLLVITSVPVGADCGWPTWRPGSRGASGLHGLTPVLRCLFLCIWCHAVES